jgi:two-component system OmpR family response regulator
MRILIVEDNEDLATELATKIATTGFDVDRVGRIDDAVDAFSEYSYPLALLDRRLPDGDGISLLQRLKKNQPSVRILILTALDAVDDRIEGLDAGADDYLTKPFNLDEMIARIRANLRKSGCHETPKAQIGRLSFDFCERAASVGETPILLLRRELALLEGLLRRANCVVSREALTSHVFGFGSEVQEHALTVLISRLRLRLAEAGAEVEVHSARGLGYMIRASISDDDGLQE